MCIDSHGCHCHNVKKWPKQHQKKWDRVYWRYLQASVSSYSTVDQYTGLTLDWPCIYPWSTLDQPSINTLVDARSTLDWLLGWQLTNFHWCTLVRSTLGWLLIKLLIKRWAQVDWGHVNWHSITVLLVQMIPKNVYWFVWGMKHEILYIENVPLFDSGCFCLSPNWATSDQNHE